MVLLRHQAIRFKDKSERSVLLLPLYALLWSFVARSALIPLQSVVLPETVLSVDFLSLCHYKQIVIQPAHASFPVLLFWARVHPVHRQLIRLSQSQWWRSVARWWKGAAFTEKMDAGFDDDELDFTAVTAEPKKQSNDPSPEPTGTKPSEFKSYRKNLKLWLLFTRTPAQF